MINRAVMLFAIWVGAAGLGTLALADSPIPRGYPKITSSRASPNTPDGVRAREAATSDAHDAACTAGDMAGCALLGNAYETGQGRLQNRPVAELLYREACQGSAARGCFQLGQLLRTADGPQDEADAARFFIRGCGLGSLAACEEQAADMAAGVLGDADPGAAEALRRANCLAGLAAACRTLGRSLIAAGRTPAERAEGGAMIDRMCRSGDSGACSDAISFWRAAEAGDGPQTRQYLALDCDAGAVFSCNSLARAELARGPEGRGTALAYFDAACALAAYQCDTPIALRSEPLLTARCEKGQMDEVGQAEACTKLGELLAKRTSVVFDQRRALALLAPACEAGTTAVCLRAGELLLSEWDAGNVYDPAAADLYLTRSCEAGSEDACIRLADELANGERLAPDPVRAAELYVPQCEAERDTACRFLADLAMNDPSAPLVAASAVYAPDLTPEETSAQAEQEQRDDEEAEARRCTNTAVIFRGVRYDDRLCTNVVRIRNGFTVKSGAAPWQALVWRPEKISRGRTALPEQRVLCGGAVIREGWILTAAHCLQDAEVGPVATSGHRIRLGVINPLLDQGFSYPILRVAKPDTYNRSNYAFDIALIQYDTRAGRRGQDAVHPITSIRLDPQPLAARPIVTGAPAFTFGWGRTEWEGGEKPDRLRAARLELLSIADCRKRTAFGAGYPLDSVVCAAGRNDEQACSGDSGGPLVTYADADKVPTLIGVVSAGVKCGTTGKPSRYTRVARVRDWITATLRQSGRR